MAGSTIDVLLVENSRDEADRLRKLLRDAGFTEFVFRHVRTLHAALERVAAEPVDLILLDLELADAQGLEGLTRLLFAAPQVPVVVLTGPEGDTLATHAVRRGAQDALVQPHLDGHLLARDMRHAIERHRVRIDSADEVAVSTAL